MNLKLQLVRVRILSSLFFFVNPAPSSNGLQAHLAQCWLHGIGGKGTVYSQTEQDLNPNTWHQRHLRPLSQHSFASRSFVVLRKIGYHVKKAQNLNVVWINWL